MSTYIGIARNYRVTKDGWNSANYIRITQRIKGGFTAEVVQGTKVLRKVTLQATSFESAEKELAALCLVPMLDNTQQ